MNTTNLEKNKLFPKDGGGDDIPFILCATTKVGAHRSFIEEAARAALSW
jgi:hypothetical protein